VIAALRMVAAREPFAGFSLPGLCAIVGLGLYAGWTLLSGDWSGARARALLEFDRALLYLAALVLFASVPSTPARLRWMVRGLALGLFAVGLCALITRVLPELWPVAESGVVEGRLNFPLGYWNAVGVLAALGLVLGLHLTSSEGEPRVVRVAAAALAPVLATTLLLTFSRGAIGMAILGVLAYVVLARPRCLLTGLLATAPATAVAIRAGYEADLLASEDPTVPEAVAQGGDLATVVVLAALAAVAVRALLLLADGWLVRARLPERARLPARARWPVWLAGSAVLAVGAVAVSVALGLPGAAERQYERFVEGGAPTSDEDQRGRLTDPRSGGRLLYWKVARATFAEQKATGAGAGTFQTVWARERPTGLTGLDAHSLYFEVLAELGLVGLVLLALTLLALLVGVLRRARGPDRAVYGAVAAATIAWAAHAGVDWDWEMSALTLWVFAVCGFAGAAVPGARRSRRGSIGTRLTAVAIAAVLVGLVAVPAQLALSQIRLDRAVRALVGGDCREGIDAALVAIEASPGRPEPYEVLGYCEARLGAAVAAGEHLERAARLDPDSWELRYGLALVRGTARLDPRPAARAALERNPLEPRTRAAWRGLRTGSPARWESYARTAPLPVPRGRPGASARAEARRRQPSLGRTPRGRAGEARRP